MARPGVRRRNGRWRSKGTSAEKVEREAEPSSWHAVTNVSISSRIERANS